MSAVVDGHDARVAQLREDHHLALEAGHFAHVGEWPLPEHLDGHTPLRRELQRFVDHALAAVMDLTDDLIAFDAVRPIGAIAAGRCAAERGRGPDVIQGRLDQRPFPVVGRSRGIGLVRVVRNFRGSHECVHMICTDKQSAGSRGIGEELRGGAHRAGQVLQGACPEHVHGPFAAPELGGDGLDRLAGEVVQLDHLSGRLG